MKGGRCGFVFCGVGTAYNAEEVEGGCWWQLGQ